jgi:hypothetical protein
MHSDTCVDVVALVVDVFHSTLSNVVTSRAEFNTIVVFSIANIWRDRTKIIA